MTNGKGKEREWDGEAGSVVPGMTLEISGPPGGGKTVLAIALALSSRLKDGELFSGEVLIVGKYASFSMIPPDDRYRRWYYAREAISCRFSNVPHKRK
jgi:DNA replication protein DnaC